MVSEKAFCDLNVFKVSNSSALRCCGKISLAKVLNFWTNENATAQLSLTCVRSKLSLK